MILIMMGNTGDMSKGGFVFHVKDEAGLKDLVGLLQGVLAEGWQEVASTLGIRSQEIWTAPTKEGPAVILTIEAVDPDKALRGFLEIESPPIGRWLLEELSITTEIEDVFDRPMELLFEFSQNEA